MESANLTIWTIGHSTRSLEDFTELLKQNKISALVDIRHYPGSRRYPHFNKDHLSNSLKQMEINYQHIVELGGRRKTNKDSKNTTWRNESFRGYADYMEGTEFQKGIASLLKIASGERTAIMCSEAVWWRCHRSMISDFLKSQSITIEHIINDKKCEEHRYTSPARIVAGKLSYHEEHPSQGELFS